MTGQGVDRLFHDMVHEITQKVLEKDKDLVGAKLARSVAHRREGVIDVSARA